MATFPHAYVKLSWKDSGEDHRPIVDRSDMEKGVPTQRRISADVLVTVPVTLYFDSAAAASDFEDWFYTGDGMGWFDFTHPRFNSVVTARIVGGNIGKLVPLRGDWTRTQRVVTIEYVRPSL